MLLAAHLEMFHGSILLNSSCVVVYIISLYFTRTVINSFQQKIRQLYSTTSSAIPGFEAERLEFLVHRLRIARFYFRTISFPNISNRIRVCKNPGTMHESRPSDVHTGEKVPAA